MRIISLEMAPHPINIKCPIAIELHYAKEDHVLENNIKPNQTEYFLSQWSTDCTNDDYLEISEHHSN